MTTDVLPVCAECERPLIGSEPLRGVGLCDDCSAALCPACRETFSDTPGHLCPDCWDEWAISESEQEEEGVIFFDNSTEGLWQRQQLFARAKQKRIREAA